MRAPTTAAADASLTVPAMDAVERWAHAGMTDTNVARAINTRREKFIPSSLRDQSLSGIISLSLPLSGSRRERPPFHTSVRQALPIRRLLNQVNTAAPYGRRGLLSSGKGGCQVLRRDF